MIRSGYERQAVLKAIKVTKPIMVRFRLFYVVCFNLILAISSFDPCSENLELVSEVTINDCGPETFFLPTGNSLHSCFPTCEKEYDIQWIDCNTKKGCPPGYYCPKTKPFKCQIDESSCFRYIAGNDINPWKQSKWKPDCLVDGTWAAVQCKPNRRSGRCFCFDKRGNRIYGEAFAEKSANMTCECSRKRVEMLESASNVYSSLHCDSMGNYEPLQCNAGQCWCVEALTGDITSKVVPEKLMTYLPCYSEANNGKHYLRQCESEEYGKANLIRAFKIHGTLYANLPHISCDGDGSYGPYQIGTSEVRCVWKDKSELGYAISAKDADFNTLTCNCARDKKIYELAGMKHLLNCESSGEYYPLQKTEDGEYYCVDADGHRKSDNYNKLELKDCLEYKQ